MEKVAYACIGGAAVVKQLLEALKLKKIRKRETLFVVCSTLEIPSMLMHDYLLRRTCCTLITK